MAWILTEQYMIHICMRSDSIQIARAEINGQIGRSALLPPPMGMLDSWLDQYEKETNDFRLFPNKLFIEKIT